MRINAVLLWGGHGHPAVYPGDDYNDIIYHRLHGTGIQPVLLVTTAAADPVLPFKKLSKREEDF